MTSASRSDIESSFPAMESNFETLGPPSLKTLTAFAISTPALRELRLEIGNDVRV